MAKSKKSSPVSAPAFPSDEEYQTRDDVDRLMRADEVHSDPKRFSKASSRIQGVASRISKRGSGRSGGRSSGR